MKKTFSEYYLMSVNEKKNLWKEALFIFDANVLLTLYQYSNKTRKDFLNILEKNKERIWIPHQFAFEYQKNRLKIIEDQSNFYKHVSNHLDKGFEDIEKQIKKSQNQHPFLKIDKILKTLSRSVKKAVKEIKEKESSHPNWFENDPIREEIDKLFDGKVGPPCSDVEDIEKLGSVRFSKKTPPGYADVKTKDNPYGDWIGWYQIMQMIKAQEEDNKKPIIFVTNENKEDWWLKINSKTISPRPELIKEIRDIGANFHMYSMEQFIGIAENHYKIGKKTREEIEEVSKKGIENLDIGSTNALEQSAVSSGVEFGSPNTSFGEAGEQKF